MSDAWVGLVGVLLGASLGYIASYLIERSRRGFEKGRRFEDQRRAVYVRMIEAANEAERVIRARHLAMMMRRDSPDHAESIEVPGKPDDAALDLAEAEIELLARFDVKRKATLLRISLQALDSVNDMILYGTRPWSRVGSAPSRSSSVRADARRDYSGGDPTDAKWNEASTALHPAKREFLRAAKRDLDLPTGVMSKRQSQIWRLRQRLGLAPRQTPKKDA